MARLLLVALLCYAGMDFSDPAVLDAVDPDEEEHIVVASSLAEPRGGKHAATVTTPPRWVAVVHVEGLEARHRSATDLRAPERVPPRLRPRHVAVLHPPDVSEDH